MEQLIIQYKNFTINNDPIKEDRLVDLIINNLPDERGNATNNLEKDYLERVYSRNNVLRFLMYQKHFELEKMLDINQQMISYCKKINKI
ncbi:MAG: hypothetical protein EOP34_03445 [Rickettsiales bacterium]|nr:MAG: hypothetical protein EOP34_03445 [Rickettsiales bacterium]